MTDDYKRDDYITCLGMSSQIYIIFEFLVAGELCAVLESSYA